MSSFSLNTSLWNTPTTISDTNMRRSSTRSIKRKKFDDELVESSLKCDRYKGKSEGKNFTASLSCPSGQVKSSLSQNFSIPKVETSTLCSGSLQSSASVLSPGSDLMSIDSPMECDLSVGNKPEVVTSVKGKYHASRISSKKSKSSKLHLSGNKPCLWKPQDDLLLITAVQQTCDLSAVHLAVKFSRPFSLSDIKERWYNLLYNQNVSRSAMNAVRRLPSETVDSLMKRTPYSIEEEQLLKNVPSLPKPTLETFEKLLEDHPDSFNPVRTPTCLFHHWSIMNEYDLIPGADSKATKIPNFFEALEKLNDSDLMESRDEDVERELQLVAVQRQREIAALEAEVKRLRQVVVKEVVGITNIEFDGETYAVLKGRLVQYSMKSKEMTLGRGTDDNVVDADLSLEGPAHKVSRKHFLIRLEASTNKQQGCSSTDKEQFHFLLHNQAKRPVLVDGIPVHRGSKTRLKEGSMIEVSCLRLSFHINDDLVSSLNRDVHHAPADSPQSAPTT